MEEVMTNRDLGGDTSMASQGPSRKQGIKEAASEAVAKGADMARDAGEKAKQVASETASTITDQVKELLDRQIGNGANAAGQFASSARLAADDLNQQSPLLASLVRGFADKVEGYADGLQQQTVEQVVQAASRFTRRQPALVFGLAAVAGFLVFRTVKTVKQTPSPSIQPGQPGEQSQHHG
jgi:ElaB/YqjD/DUF883 family membrane-anchored ribosome-binding protein